MTGRKLGEGGGVRGEAADEVVDLFGGAVPVDAAELFGELRRGAELLRSLDEGALHAQLERILSDDAPFYRAFYDRMTAPQSDE